MKRINIAELLKDCPKGMELDCTIYNGVKFVRLDRNPDYTIVIRANNGYEFTLTKYGQVYNVDDAKCVIFPKGKTTWEGFVPPCPFKDGDVVYIKTKDYNQNEFIIIFKEIKNDHIHKHACFAYQVLYTSKNAVCHLADVEEARFATEEEKQKLFDVIKTNGYKWNAETKTLEKLVEPKFKVGDKIKHRLTGKVYMVLFVQSNGDEGGVYDVAVTNEIGTSIDIKEQDNYELVPNKFDISTLKPFDKVLVKLTKDGVWNATFFSHYDKEVKWGCYPFVTTSSKSYSMCIPYENNEHLLGTTDDCDNFYKTWE